MSPPLNTARKVFNSPSPPALLIPKFAAVKESGERVALRAMTPFERKVVHDAVAAAGLTSESEGVEPRRYVVVLPV